MAYATYQDALDRYGAAYVVLSADRDDDDVVDSTAWTRALDDATALMDSYLGVRTTVPLTTVTEVIEQYCIDIAVYNLSMEASVLTEAKEARYKAAMAWLKDFAKGISTLALPTGEEPTGVQEVISFAEDRVATRDSLKRLW